MDKVKEIMITVKLTTSFGMKFEDNIFALQYFMDYGSLYLLLNHY